MTLAFSPDGKVLPTALHQPYYHINPAPNITFTSLTSGLEFFPIEVVAHPGSIFRHIKPYLSRRLLCLVYPRYPPATHVEPPTSLLGLPIEGCPICSRRNIKANDRARSNAVGLNRYHHLRTYLLSWMLLSSPFMVRVTSNPWFLNTHPPRPL
jgi:hypothetical protein